jgi:cation:H+ antiporter
VSHDCLVNVLEGPFVLYIFLLLSGLGILILGADLVVRGASRLARAAGMSPLIIGLTIVAFGTCAPELAVNIKAGIEDKTALAVGNVLGGNIFNVLFILGLCSVVVPLRVKSRLVRINILLMVLTFGLACFFALNKGISFTESILLLLTFLAYVLFTVMYAKKHPPEEPPFNTERPHESHRIVWLLRIALFIVFGSLLLVFGARWLVEGASGIARLGGVSELTIGLLIVGVGTSLPELATSLVAAIRGKHDIAVGNLVGGNIFNTLCVLSVAGLFSADGLALEGFTRELDFPVMFAAGVVCLPVFLVGAVISRTEGFCLLLSYALYFILVILRTATSPLYYRLADLFFYILLPAISVIIIGYFWVSYREIKQLAAEITEDLSDLAAATLKHARKVVVTVIGFTLILAGVAMMVLPGPATIVIPLGLAILSTEFIWAQRLLRYIRKEVENAAQSLMGREKPKEE